MPTGDSELERRTIRKIAIRLVPFVGLLFLINYMDRSALSFAGPNGLNEDLGLTAAQFGFAAGVFLIGYIAVEVPSNLALHRFGARRWLARIMVSWGIVTVLFAWVNSETELYVLRFILGVAEAGFFPGAILFLSTWVPRRHRSKILAFFYVSQPLSLVVGAPLAGLLISVGKWFPDIAGWRVMFIGLGLPAIIFGVVCWFYLADKPADAKWLDTDERQWLEGELASEIRATKAAGDVPLRKVFTSGRVWILILMFFGLVYCIYALNFFLPTIIAGFAEQFGTQLNVFQQGLVTAIPYSFAVVALVVWSLDATRRGTRWWHISAPCLLAAVAVSITLLMPSAVSTIAMTCVVAVGLFAALPVFWSLPTRFLTGVAAAAGVAFINTVANIGGFLAGYLTGLLHDLSGSYVLPMCVVGLFLTLTAVLMFTIRAQVGVDAQTPDDDVTSAPVHDPAGGALPDVAPSRP